MNTSALSQNQRYSAVLIVCVIWMLPLCVSSQQLPSTQSRADFYFSQFDYSHAASYYHKLAGRLKPQVRNIRFLAECYRHLRLYPEAEQAYAGLASRPDATELDHYWYGRCLQSAGKYAQALLQFQLISKDTASATLDSLVKGCRMFNVPQISDANYVVKNEDSLNTRFADFGPTMDKAVLVFTSDRPSNGQEERAMRDPRYAASIFGWTGNPYMKLYALDRVGGSQISLLPASINGRYNDGPAAFTANGRRVYFTRTDKRKPGPKKGSRPAELAGFSSDVADPFINHLEIWYADSAGAGWGAPRPLPFNSSASYSVGHPALSPDGRTLFFASDMPGGKGGLDLYSSAIQENGEFTTPVNLGPSINTAGQEEFPTMGVDGQLYFSSDGLPGMGGLDIFSSEGSGTSWTTPYNLGSPLNSPRDDFYMTPINQEATSGFFSSDRQGGKGNDDLYSFTVTQNYSLQMTLLSRSTGLPVGGVHLVIITSAGPLSAETDTLGAVRLVSPQRIASIATHRTGFKDSLFQITSKSYHRQRLELIAGLQELGQAETQSILLPTVLYDFNRSSLRKSSYADLNKLASLLLSSPHVRIAVNAHTDMRGSMLYNLKLSQRRAASVVAYLRTQGVSTARIVAKGYGKSRPRRPCPVLRACTEADHQANRRTEFEIITP